MIVGQYRDFAARVMLTVSGEDGDEEIEFVLDTAFEGDLSLPSEVIRRLGLPFLRDELRLLADGTVTRCRVFEAELEWNDDRRSEVLSLATRPLIGMSLLDGCHIDIEATEGGEVLIEPLN